VSTEEESDREGDETGRLLRATVDELQKALIESRTLLSERDTELSQLRNELEQHRKQVNHFEKAGLSPGPGHMHKKNSRNHFCLIMPHT